jgi:RNA polymerase sigma-70 factor (ECF subfamily)
LDADEDDRILRCYRQGDEPASPEAVRRLHERIFRLAWRMSGDVALAEEAAAEALVKIWRNAKQWREESAAGTWIYRLAVRTIFDFDRGQRRWRRRWASVPAVAAVDGRPGPAEAAEGREHHDARSARLHEALAQLGPADRGLVHLYYFENRSLPEIAEILKVNRDALKMRLVRARAKLRTILVTDDAHD